MKEDKISELLNDLFKKKIRRNSSSIGSYDVDLIDKEGRAIVEASIRNFLLDNRDEKLGILEAKVFTYEQIISKSNFAQMVIPDPDPTPDNKSINH